MQLKLVQKQTQQNGGGMTEVYLDSGTYVKSSYSLLYAPSCVKIFLLKDGRGIKDRRRLHHKVNWNAAVPCIVRESVKKMPAQASPE